MRYSYGDKTITFHISGNDENSVMNRSVDGKIINTLTIDNDSISIDVLELTNTINEEKAYSAQWIYKNTYNCLEGCWSLTEIEKILKNMMY